ncbi:MAG: flagellar hook-basal body complex protein [Pirellulales bacterium]|nr:flagellar hook-basal body complex protein [Pirellulales bacterium]
MGLQSALSTALTGMNAAETSIDVVGNNVANSNTVGFKESEALFATQFLQTQSLGSAPTTNTGGTNPRQIGLGVQIAQITPDFTQGTIEISSNSLDMAIQGDGFFIVQGSDGAEVYTRNGQFSTNSDNELVTINGQRVLGYGVDDDFIIQETSLQPITIPLGSSSVAQATQNVFLEGTLIPTGQIGDTPEIIQSAILSNGNYEVPSNLGASDIESVAPPNVSTTTAGADPTAGSIAAGTYSYRLIYRDSDGNQTTQSDIIGPITTTGTPLLDQSIELSGLPTISDPYVGLDIYRSMDGGDYQYVTTRTAADPLSYIDSAAQGSLGAVLNTNSLDIGNYSYYITFFDNAGGTLESRPTANIGPVSITSTDQRVRIDNIPWPTGGDFDSVRIYRNLSNDSSSYHLVTTLTGGETSYMDGIPDADIISEKEINLDGPAIGFGTLLTDVVCRDGATYTALFDLGTSESGTLTFTGRKGGRTLGTQELVITETTTVLDLMEFMNESMGIQETPGPDPLNPIPGDPGGSITGDSRIQFTSNMGVQNALDIGLSAFQLSVGGAPAEPVTLPFNSVQTAEGEGTVTDFIVYDSLGIPLAVRITTVLETKTSTGTSYRWFAESPDNDPITGVETAVGTGVITFDGEGNLVSVSEATVSIDRRNVASESPLEFELDFSQISGLAEESSSVNASRQDGSGAGSLSSFIITETGRIVGVFSNGISRDLGQIRLARFPNNNGLEQIGANLFARGVNSGLPIGGDPGANGIGTITAGAVELSNTDIGQNLIELILASTQYRGGARVITAVQELLDELMALRR